MKSSYIVVLSCLMALMVAGVDAQGTVSSPSGQKTLAATINVYVFPTVGQTPEQQGADEASCYGWAVQNTGTDPFNLAKQEQQNEQNAAAAKQQASNAGKGAGATGAVRGAAVGALIGGIASNDAGKGAAYGAAAGAVRGRRQGRRAQSQATAQAEAQAGQARQYTAEQSENFKKAFSVCLEAQQYMVRY